MNMFIHCNIKLRRFISAKTAVSDQLQIPPGESNGSDT